VKHYGPSGIILDDGAKTKETPPQRCKTMSTYADLWVQETEGKAKSFYTDWYYRVIRARMAPMKKLARSLKERIGNIVTYCTHWITNAVAEGINSKIMSIKRRLGGYRNIENFNTVTLFYCSGLDLDPR